MQARLLSGASAFDEIAGEWRELAAQRPPADHTGLEGWARAATSANADRGGLWLCAHDADGPVAVLHLIRERRRVAGLPARVVRNGDGGGLMVEGADAGEVRRQLISAAARAGMALDVLSLNRVRPTSGFYALASVLPGGLRDEPQFGGFSVISTGVSAEQWFQEAGKNLRGSLRKARNRAKRQGAVRVVEAKSPGDVHTAFERFQVLEAKGWKGAAGALRNRLTERQLLGDFLVSEAGNGLAQARELWIGDELGASQLAVIAGSTAVLLKVAYDEDLSDMSPGNLLMADLVERCCDEPEIEHLDLVTRQPWHARWHPETQPTYRAQGPNRRRLVGLAAWGASSGLPARLVTRRSGSAPSG